MALTASEEALVRQLLDQQAAILSLAGNEATITSKLGATKVTLADLVVASGVADADLLLIRQGTTDKSVTPLLLKSYAQDGMATQKGVQAGDYNTSVATGTADAITGDYTPNILALEDGLTLFVRATAANTTTTPTFAPDSLTAKTVVKGNNLALAVGDIAGAGHWLEMNFDATLDKWVLQNPARGVASTESHLMVRDERSSGTAGGASVVGIQTRTLNTVSFNTISGASLASNQITLPAGTYRVRAKSPTVGVNISQAWLYNVTDASVTIRGSSENGVANSSGDPMTVSSWVEGRFTIASTKVFELRQYSNEVHANGLGAPVSQGTEVYSYVEIVKEP